MLRTAVRAATAAVLFALLAPVDAKAAVVEDFGYGSGTLRDKNGGSGWAGSPTQNNWAYPKTGTSTITIGGGNLSFSTGGYAVAQTGTGYAVGGYSTFRGINRNIAAPASGTVWFSLLVYNASTSGRSGIQFNHAASNDYDRGAFDIMLSGTSLEVNYGSAITSNVATGLAVATTHLILGKWEVGAGNDALSVWIDPASLASLGSPLFSAANKDVGASITRLGIMAWGTDGARVDALRLSDGPNAFLNVTGVPEPAGLCLLACGSAALLRRRRA